MKLKDIANMESYLQNDCYCPGEIYDITGFCFQIFNKEDKCKKIGEKKSKENGSIILCVACKNQLINFWIHNGKITDAQRYDATENNIKFMKLFLAGKSTEGMHIDEFKGNSSMRTLNDILQTVDAIMLE